MLEKTIEVLLDTPEYSKVCVDPKVLRGLLMEVSRSIASLSGDVSRDILKREAASMLLVARMLHSHSNPLDAHGTSSTQYLNLSTGRWSEKDPNLEIGICTDSYLQKSTSLLLLNSKEKPRYDNLDCI